MAVAIVTGASSGIGEAVSEMLLAQSWTVWGIARDFSKCDINHENFIKTVCDVTDPAHLSSSVRKILDRAKTLDVLVNNAGVGCFGPHETLDVFRLAEMVETNLTAPMVLSKLVLRHLRESRGHIINIASSAALYPHRFGCAYAATKAGLLHFGESLFDEVRKSGVKVSTICPDMSRGTEFYKDAPFHPEEDAQCRIEPGCAAEAVRSILSQRDGTVQTLVVLRPQRVGVARKRKSRADKTTRKMSP